MHVPEPFPFFFGNAAPFHVWSVHPLCRPRLRGFCHFMVDLHILPLDFGQGLSQCSISDVLQFYTGHWQPCRAVSVVNFIQGFLYPFVCSEVMLIGDKGLFADCTYLLLTSPQNSPQITLECMVLRLHHQSLYGTLDHIAAALQAFDWLPLVCRIFTRPDGPSNPRLNKGLRFSASRNLVSWTSIH